MLDIKKIKLEPEKYINLLSKKGYQLQKEISLLLKTYDDYLSGLKEMENSRLELNDISKKISLNNFSNETAKETCKKQAQLISEKVKKTTELVSQKETEYTSILLTLPNTPFEEINYGKDEKDNKVLKIVGTPKQTGLNHFEIFEKKPELVYTKESIKLSGSRHVVYGHESSKLIRAIESFMLDNNEKNGYRIFEAPVIVNSSALVNTGQLPKFEDDLFKLNNGQYLIPTSEVTLTNLVSNEILDEKKLPIKMTSLSNCFRSEAGAAGRDTRGIIRVHQFRKVELVQIGRPENHLEDFSSMLKSACEILDLLELPYRVVELCTGDMTFSSAKTYDIEVWLPGPKTYREISSVSCMSDFQSRRMKTRIKTDEGKAILPYTYNGSALAIERTFVAIVENYYNEKTNTILIPKVLKKYLPFESI